MRKFLTGAALTGVAVLTFGAGTAFADEPNNCSDFCNVGGDTDVGEGTAVGPAAGVPLHDSRIRPRRRERHQRRELERRALRRGRRR